MPKLLTDDRLNRVQYISIADYMSSMDSLDDFEDKMEFTTRYLLAYGVGQQRDVSFAEAIHIAKVKIADASSKLRENQIMIPDEAVNPNLTDEQDALNRLFMINPVEYLQRETNRLLMNEANKGEEANQNKIDNYQIMSAYLANNIDGALESEVSELDIEPTTRDVDARLKAKFGGVQQFEEAYNKTKPGFLSKMFGTSSVAYRNLDQAYEAFNNPDHALYGNMNSLDKAATEYLKHCFPKWNPKNGGISKSAIERLSGTKKARAMFSLNILKVTEEQRKIDGLYENIISSNIQKRADIEAGADDEVLEQPKSENDLFRERLKEDLAKDEIASEISPEEEEAYHANFVDGPEVDNN